MKKYVFALFVFLFVDATYALSPGWYSKQLKYWGVGTSGNVTGIGYSLATADDPNTWISFDSRMQDTIEKQKLLAAILASIKSMGGNVRFEIGTNGQIVNLFDGN